MDHFYHYSTLNGFRSVVSGDHYGKTGLIPLKRVLRVGLSSKFNLPAKAEEGAVFGLLEPQPAAWMTKDYHPGQGLLETILRDMQLRGDEMLLLKCEVDPADDIHVADHIFHMRKDYNGIGDLDNPATGEVKRAYWKSLVSFAGYRGGYELPEVICFSPIPLERISIVEKYDSMDDLVNELRLNAGKAPLPPRAKPDPAHQAKMLEKFLSLKI